MHSAGIVVEYRQNPVAKETVTQVRGVKSDEDRSDSYQKGKFAKPRASAAEERARLEADFKRMTHAANHEPEWEEDDGAQEARRKKRLKIAVISTACLLAVVLIGLGIFLWSYSRDDGLIFDNVYALDINLGGMSQEQATQVLEEKAQAVYGAPLTIQLQDRTLVLTPEETKAQLDAAALAEAACRYGRDGNMFDRAGPGRQRL